MPTDEEGASDAGSTPGEHPEPPEDLHERRPSLFEGAGPWVRLHPAGLEPIYFGKEPSRAGRFSAPNGKYGILYVAEDEFGAFVERFGHDTGVRIIDEEDLLAAGLARIEAPRNLRLVDLTGEGLARLGADSRLFAGDHGVARRWGAALRDHPERPDGIRYPCRHDPSRAAAALFDHVYEGLTAASRGTMLDEDNKATLAEILRTYDFGLA